MALTLAPANRVDPHFIERCMSQPFGSCQTAILEVRGKARRLWLSRSEASKRRSRLVSSRTLFTDRFPTITRAYKNLPPHTLTNRHAIAIDANKAVSFNALQHRRPNAHIQFYAFDVLVHRNRNVLRLPPEQRRASSSGPG